MADSILEQIAQDIQAAVNGITIELGFQQDLVCARPTRRDLVELSTADHVPADRSVLLLQDDEEWEEALSSPGNPPRHAWRQRFALVCFVVESDESETAIDTAINRVKADVETKLMEDAQRSGLAVDTKLAGSVRFAPTPEQTGITVGIEVLYRVRENDPYANAG